MGIGRAVLACVAWALLWPLLACDRPEPNALETTTAQATSKQRSARMGMLRGEVVDYNGRPLAGAMVTAHDDNSAMNVSVFTDGDGHYEFPALELGTYELRVRIVGFERRVRMITLTEKGAHVQFLLRLAGEIQARAPAYRSASCSTSARFAVSHAA